MDEKRTIIIDLDNSLFAHGFTNEQQIHQDDLDKAIDIIQNQIKQCGTPNDTTVFLSHNYRTIGVFGDRGSGKTSFMISLLNKCKEDMKDVMVLRMIDPTLVEHKKPIILCVISMIQQLVESELCVKECSITENGCLQRRGWSKLMEKIARGVFAIDNVGKGYNDSLWQDESYVMHTGLAKVNDANSFEENLREMIAKALDILHKKAFILAFDDIDMDVEQGWNVLESLRRYLSDTHIISIVSGNIKLYGTLVRYELGQNLKMPEGNAHKMMANEMENQYMLKLLNPKYRINLLSLSNLIHNGNYIVKVRSNDTEDELSSRYRSILNEYNIVDIPSQNTFISFLMSMSLRSQIHFLNDASVNKNTPPLDIFKSRMYALGIDVDALEANAQMINISILEYLNTTDSLPDCYLLLPTLPDKDVNSNFTALTILECSHMKKNPDLVFDYLLRIGYIRNIVLPLEKYSMVSKVCKYAGWNQLMSLKNNIGLTMAYVAGKRLGSMKEHISLYAMEEKAKKGKDSQRNALDKVLKEEGKPLSKLLAMFPFLRITHSKDNESRSYYSFISLLSAIGDILRCLDKEEMTTRISDLKLFRSYQMPQDESNFAEDEQISGSDYGVEINQEDIDKLADMMFKWKQAYTTYLPPYSLGRIMTRLYTSLSNVEVNSVGQMMSVMVANFFNSCLIEESRVRVSTNEQVKINNSNLRSDTRYFKDNLNNNDIVGKLTFTKWIMSCPMLNCFLDEDTFGKIQVFLNTDSIKDRNSYTVYVLLSKVNSKDAKVGGKPKFSGGKDGWTNTAILLRENGINDDIIHKRIIAEGNIDSAVEFIKSKNLFSNVNKGSVKSFIKNYRKESVDTVPSSRPIK